MAHIIVHNITICSLSAHVYIYSLLYSLALLFLFLSPISSPPPKGLMLVLYLVTALAVLCLEL